MLITISILSWIPVRIGCCPPHSDLELRSSASNESPRIIVHIIGLGVVAPGGAIEALLPTPLAEAPNVLGIFSLWESRGADLVRCHGVTDQKHLECQKHLNFQRE